MAASTQVLQVPDGEESEDELLIFARLKNRVLDMYSAYQAAKARGERAEKDLEVVKEKQRHTDAEHAAQVSAVQAELLAAQEGQRKLESAVKALKNEVDLIARREKGLREEMKAVLNSRDSAAEDLKVSKYELERALQSKEAEHALLLEKHSRLPSLFDSVERESKFIKRIVDETREMIVSKEALVSALTMRLSRVLGVKGKFVEKIKALESNLEDATALVSAKNAAIRLMEEKLDNAKHDNSLAAQLSTLRETVEIKEHIISSLSSDKEELLSEVQILGEGLLKMQATCTQQDKALITAIEELVAARQEVQMLREKVKEVNDLSFAAMQESETLVHGLEEKQHRFVTREGEVRSVSPLLECSPDMPYGAAKASCKQKTLQQRSELFKDAENEGPQEGTEGPSSNRMWSSGSPGKPMVSKVWIDAKDEVAASVSAEAKQPRNCVSQEEMASKYETGANCSTYSGERVEEGGPDRHRISSILARLSRPPSTSPSVLISHGSVSKGTEGGMCRGTLNSGEDSGEDSEANGICFLPDSETTPSDVLRVADAANGDCCEMDTRPCKGVLETDTRLQALTNMANLEPVDESISSREQTVEGATEVVTEARPPPNSDRGISRAVTPLYDYESPERRPYLWSCEDCLDFQGLGPCCLQEKPRQPTLHLKDFQPVTSIGCVCNVPAYGPMLDCRVCQRTLHIGCVVCDGADPGPEYVCNECADVPKSKRCRVDASEASGTPERGASSSVFPGFGHARGHADSPLDFWRDSKEEDACGGALQLQGWSVQGNLPDFTLASPFSDVKLVSATEVVLFGSKYNLSQRSPVLNRMLLNGMKETSPAQDMVSISFPDMSTEALKFLLEYSFTGAIRVYRYHKTPVEVIHVCRYFQLHEDPVQVLEEALHHLQMSNTDGHLGYCEISDRAADILSKALECLSVEEDKELFDYLLKILLSRHLQSISPQCLTAKALRFLLSRSLGSDAAEITPFATTEVDTCLYLMLWAAQQLPGTAVDEMQDFVNKLEFAAETDTELIAKLKPELTKQIAAIVLPFLPLIDFRLMRSRDIALIIKPLQVIPQDMMFEALCYQAAHLGKATQILYRGPFVVQWDSNARYTMLQLSNTDDGRELSCMGFTGCARTVSPARGTGVYEWEFRIKHENLRSEIGIGLCTDRGPDSFKYAVWLGHESNGWILDSNSRFWHNTTCVPAKSNITFSGLEARVLVRLDMRLRQCVFTYNDVRVVAPWTNIPDEVYPAVSFLRSAAANRTQVKILPANCCEPVDV